LYPDEERGFVQHIGPGVAAPGNLLTCPVCKRESTHDKLRDHVSEEFGTTFEILECTGCGTRRTHPFLTDQQLNDYYTNEEIAGGGKYFKWQGKYRYIHDWVAKRVNVQGKRIVEVGSNAGNLLRYFKEYSQCDVTGIEFSTACVEYSENENGVPVFCGPLDQYRVSVKEKADLVVLVHVFEHITEPVSFLRDVHAVLNDDGSVYIEIPNARMIDFDLLGDIANPLCIPFHAYLYQMDSLTRILEQNGFKVVAKRYWSRKEDGGSITGSIAHHYQNKIPAKFGENIFSKVLAKTIKLIVRFYPNRFLIGYYFSKRNKSTTIACLCRKI